VPVFDEILTFVGFPCRSEKLFRMKASLFFGILDSYSRFIKKIFYACNSCVRCYKMSLSAEFEQLLNEKAALEDESRDLEEEQKKVEMRAKALCNRIIEDLKNKNDAKREAISQLQSKADELEAQLEKLSAPGFLEKAGIMTSENAEKPQSADAVEASEAKTESEGEATVMVAALDKEAETGENLKVEQERKKHKFF
jgi:hypothetical protein